MSEPVDIRYKLGDGGLAINIKLDMDQLISMVLNSLTDDVPLAGLDKTTVKASIQTSGDTPEMWEIHRVNHNDKPIHFFQPLVLNHIDSKRMQLTTLDVAGNQPRTSLEVSRRETDKYHISVSHIRNISVQEKGNRGGDKGEGNMGGYARREKGEGNKGISQAKSGKSTRNGKTGISSLADHTKNAGPHHWKQVAPENWNSHQVVQYIATRHLATYREPSVEISMGSRGVLVSKVKNNLLNKFKTQLELGGEDIKEYIDWVYDEKAGQIEFPVSVGFIISPTVIQDWYMSERLKVTTKQGRSRKWDKMRDRGKK